MMAVQSGELSQSASQGTALQSQKKHHPGMPDGVLLEQ
jgi:hypothetical protein